MIFKRTLSKRKLDSRGECEYMSLVLILNQLYQSRIFDLQSNKMETFLNLLMILGSLCQLYGLLMLHILFQGKAQISRNRQILASFTSRINRKTLLLNKKPQPIRSIMLGKTRTKKRMVGKILEQRSGRYRMGRKLSHVAIQFFDLVTILQLYLQKQQTKMRNPVVKECQVAIFLLYISDKRRYRKTTNAFGISRSSVSILIRKSL